MSEHADKLVNVEGVVKWFDPKKGFGFIVGPQGQDIFTHYTKIEGEGFRVLQDGAAVVYDAEKTDKGWHASRVVRVGPVEDPAAAKRHYARTPRR
jgi:CspA family cold shock protein